MKRIAVAVLLIIILALLGCSEPPKKDSTVVNQKSGKGIYHR